MTETARKPSTRRELLLGFSALAAAAVSVAVLATLLAQYVPPGMAIVALVFLVAADVAVFLLFGRYLIERLLLRPLAELTAAAGEIAAGNLERRAPGAETAEFADLANRFNEMTDRLLDARGQLVQAEKLAGLGRLAAGVAHEVGNPLSAIGTYVDVLRKRGAEPETLAAVTRETERIDRIVRGLLAYARPRDEATGLLDLAAILRGSVELLAQQGVLRGVEVRVSAAPPAPAVRGRYHEIEQVTVNLLLNAVDATTGGVITASVEPWAFVAGPGVPRRRSDEVAFARPSRAAARRPFRPELRPGTPGALLVVADSGPGIPPDQRERVFDPFYTTKAPGAGTGLGLAIVQRTVHELGGLVWVDQAREGGAAFKVFLPAAVQEPA